MLTREEMQALRAPFELSVHTVRAGFRHAAKTKIRWFVYIDRSAIADRLDDMFLGDWGMAEPQIHIQDKKVSAVVGITIRGITRYDGGEDDSDEGTKGALTNAFRRTAAYGWGMARYLYDMDFDIWTDAYEQGKWDDMRARKNEAFQKFAEWYKKQFGSVGNTTQKAPPAAQKPAQQTPQAQSTTEPLELVDNGVYRVNSFTMNMSKGRVQKPYMVFAIGNSAAFSYTREPFRVAGYNVDDWTKVSNYELPTAADITVEKDKSGYFIVKSVKMIDLFADSKSA